MELYYQEMNDMTCNERRVWAYQNLLCMGNLIGSESVGDMLGRVRLEWWFILKVIKLLTPLRIRTTFDISVYYFIIASRI